VTHPILAAAAAGTLPAWAEASTARQEHLDRVADLMERWANDLGLEREETVRWRAAGMLHDALRDADPRALRPMVDAALRDAPGDLLHGPAAAARLREDGVRDEPLLRAIAWHTLGHPDLDRLGRGLYLADYLEPGRRHDPERAAAWRERIPTELPAVLQELAAARIGHTLRKGRPLLEPTVGFWNGLVHE
jgi:HD superfamily phosphohydrolase YqeK